jgi:magnesium-transporting ATPase (P-type)
MFLCIPRVLRDGEFKTISAMEVVPGDVVALQRGPVTGDLVVLRGANIILDESAVTGETTPVAKRAIDEKMRDNVFDVKLHAPHWILAGTSIEQAHDADVALVVSTGSFTVKGGLLTDIVAFERKKPLFEEDIQVVTMLLLAESLVIVAISVAWLGQADILLFFDSK